MILHISHEQSKCSTGFTTLFFHFCSDCECRVPRPPFVSLADIKERTQLDTNAGHAELRSFKVLENNEKTFVKLRQCQCFCMTLHQGPVQGTGMRGAFGTLMPTDQNHCKQVQCTYGTSQVVIARTLICMPDRINDIWIRPHRFGGEGVLIGGQNSNTKCSMTFVNIAVAISALAGGAKNGFAPRPEYGGVFDIFRGFLGVWAQEGIEMEFWVILVAFRQWKNGQKWKKTLYIARFCRVFGCQSIENTAKTSVLDWRYSKKRVNYRMLDWKHYKNTVKSNVLEGFTAFMAKNV